METSARKRYKQRFRAQWLRDPLLKDWLGYEDVVSVDESMVVRRPKCIYCQQLLTLRYMDLTKHGTTAKHLKNLAKTPSDTVTSKGTKGTELVNAEEDEPDGEEERVHDEYSEEDHTKDENAFDGSEEVPSNSYYESNHGESTAMSLSVGATLRSVYTSKRKMVVSEGGDISVVAAKENDDGQELDRSLRQTESYDSAGTIDTRLRLERRAVELEQEKVKLYLLKLDALQREKELGLPRSQVTRDL